MIWTAVVSGLINGVFFLDLIVTLVTGEGLADLLVDYSGNSVAEAVLANIPGDPAVFWILAGFVLFFVLAIEVLLVYIAVYGDLREARQ